VAVSVQGFAPRHLWPTRAIFTGSGALVVLGAMLFGASQLEFHTAGQLGVAASSPVLSGWRASEQAGCVVLTLGALGLLAGIISLRL
jgi:hypothetical protein